MLGVQVQDAFASRGASAGGATHVCTAYWGLEKVLKPQRLPQAAALRAGEGGQPQQKGQWQNQSPAWAWGKVLTEG